MVKIYDFFRKYYIFLIINIILVGIIVFLCLKYLNNSSIESDQNNELISFESDSSINESTELITVDIKGAVKKPGIYKLEEKSTIYDVIKKAGGLLKTSTTIDLNLSKTISNEMVIYVSTKNELKNRLNKCECNNSVRENNTYEIASKETFVSDYNNKTANETIISNKSSENKSNNDISKESNNIININTATIEEMQKIPGIGQSKAEKIIAYRNENGLFKTIEDIKNVSGIGDSIYEKIKDYITI